jgi:hypothetical protein
MRGGISQQQIRDNTGKWELSRHLLGYLEEWENGRMTSSGSCLIAKGKRQRLCSSILIPSDFNLLHGRQQSAAGPPQPGNPVLLAPAIRYFASGASSLAAIASDVNKNDSKNGPSLVWPNLTVEKMTSPGPDAFTIYIFYIYHSMGTYLAWWCTWPT